MMLHEGSHVLWYTIEITKHAHSLILTSCEATGSGLGIAFFLILFVFSA